MNISAQPNQYSAAFNSMPVGLFIPPANDIENYVAKINIVYNAVSIDSITATSENTCDVEFTGPYYFFTGDTIFIYDRTTTDGFYTGFYTILKLNDDNTVSIDMSISIPFPYYNDLTDISYAYSYIPYQMEPNQYFINLDIHNTIKDFVGTGLVGNTNIEISGQETFEYGLIFGEEYNFVYNFQDNGFTADGLGFITTQYTDVDQIPFQIGDQVNIVQDPQEWKYDDNYFNAVPGGSLGFVSTNTHNFQVGDKVFITGQNTYPQSNGYANIVAVPDNMHIVVDKGFPGSTPAEPGYIYGYPTPQNDGNATIIDIYVSGGYMWIVVDKPYTEATLPISGQMRLINNKKFGNLAVETTIIFPEDFNPIYSYAHLCRFDRQHYARIYPGFGELTTDLMDPFIVGDPGRLWSTILPQDQAYFTSLADVTWNKIDRNSPGLILFRQQHFSDTAPITAAFVLYTCYDANRNTIGQFYADAYLQTTDSVNGYAYTSLFELLTIQQGGGDVTNIGAFDLESEFNNIFYFDMRLYSDASGNYYPTAGDEISVSIRFEIDTDCSGLPTYHLTWLDSFGSYITYPFKYNAVQSTDVKRNNYYRNEFDWNNIVSIRPPFPPQFISTQFSTGTYRGENTYNVSARTKLQLTSGWLKDKENIIFEDLMKSADVYVSMSDIDMSKDTTLMIESSNNLYTYSAQLEPNNIEYKSNYAGDFIFNYTPTVRFAFNDYRYNNWSGVKQQRGGGKK